MSSVNGLNRRRKQPRNRNQRRMGKKVTAPIPVKELSPAAAAILANEPKTAAQVLRGRYSAQLGEKQIAKKLLDQLIASNPNDEALLEAYDKLHADTLLRLPGQDFLKPKD